MTDKKERWEGKGRFVQLDEKKSQRKRGTATYLVRHNVHVGVRANIVKTKSFNHIAHCSSQKGARMQNMR